MTRPRNPKDRRFHRTSSRIRPPPRRRSNRRACRCPSRSRRRSRRRSRALGEERRPSVVRMPLPISPLFDRSPAKHYEATTTACCGHRTSPKGRGALHAREGARAHITFCDGTRCATRIWRCPHCSELPPYSFQARVLLRESRPILRHLVLQMCERGMGLSRCGRFRCELRNLRCSGREPRVKRPRPGRLSPLRAVARSCFRPASPRRRLS